jgi:hypothetical protein
LAGGSTAGVCWFVFSVRFGGIAFHLLDVSRADRFNVTLAHVVDAFAAARLIQGKLKCNYSLTTVAAGEAS